MQIVSIVRRHKWTKWSGKLNDSHHFPFIAYTNKIPPMIWLYDNYPSQLELYQPGIRKGRIPIIFSESNKTQKNTEQVWQYGIQIV